MNLPSAVTPFPEECGPTLFLFVNVSKATKDGHITSTLMNLNLLHRSGFGISYFVIGLRLSLWHATMKFIAPVLRDIRKKRILYLQTAMKIQNEFL